jgi:type VII secretion integral membrane protein EccD
MTNSQTAVSAGEVCRLTIYGPNSRVELAVPAHVPLADLMPTFLGHLGQTLATNGLEHGEWVLQRLGEAPLEEDLGTAALGLYDGDIVYLRPRSDQLAPVDFDDLVDGVATGIAGRRDAWRPAFTRRLSLGLGLFCFATGAVVLPVLGSGLVVGLAGGMAAILLLAAAAAMVRAEDDVPAGTALGAAAVGYALLAGFALPAGTQKVTLETVFSPGGFLAAGVFGAVAALATQSATHAHAAPLRGGAGAGALLALAGLCGLAGLRAPAVAAVLVPLALILAYLVPGSAAKLAGLKIDPPPVSAEEFQQDLDPVPAEDLLRRTTVADSYLAAIYLGLGAIVTGALVVLAADGRRSAVLLVLATSTVLLLLARELLSARQRLAMLVPGVLGPAAALVAGVLRMTPPARTAVLVLILALGLLACLAARMMPGRRMLPHWGLAGDIAHWLVAASVLPLALGVIGVYARVRGAWM